MSSQLSQAFVVWRLAAIVVFNKLAKYLSRIVPRKKMLVVIEQGTLEGLHYKTCVSKNPYVSFLGIPYAKPPIGDLRFKPPVKHPGWSGVLKAHSEGNACLQYDVLFTKKIIGNEDCLYLNVFTPQQELLSDEKKSVMVFIHGGAFNLGSASTDLYCPDYLLDENVIVVTVNYRLNVLGFLNFGIDECPGNMGLKDQLFALKWVKANISKFGGDPDNITLFGESAGSASVHCHVLSPLSKGSFQRAIMQSGCVFNSWALHRKHKEVAFKMAKKFGCTKDDPKEIVQFLLSVPAHDLVEYSKLNKLEKDEDMIVLNYEFVPSVESDAVTEQFFPDHPDVLVKSINPIPIISGLNNMEGLIGFGEERVKNINDFKKPEEIRKLLENKYSEEVVNKVKNFYFNDNDDNEQTNLENICHMISDIFFVKEFHRGFNQLLKQNVTPVYNYEFKFDGEINIFKKLLCTTRPKWISLKGACHGDELSYIFHSQLLGFTPKVNSVELKMCKIICTLWSNFAKTGNPNSEDLNFEWKSTSASNPKYLSLDGDDTCMVDGLLYSSRVNFWKEIFETT